MANHDKLKELLLDVFLLEPEEYDISLERQEIDTWDSLGVVSMAVGVQETFGYHMTPDEAVAIDSIQDIIDYLVGKGVAFAGA